MVKAHIKERAYALFLQGENPEQIAATLKPERPTLSANSVRDWAKDGKWDDARSSVEMIVRRRIEAASTDARTKAKMRYDEILPELHQAIMDRFKAGYKPKNLEQALYALRAVQEAAVKLDEVEVERWDAQAIAFKYLEAMEAVPAIEKAVRENWSEFSAAVARKLDVATHTREITAEVTQ